MAKSTLRGFSPARRYEWNREAEVSGLWREIEDGAAKLKIARFNNPEHTAFLRQAREENLKVLEAGGKAAEELLGELGNQAMSKFILVGWEGIQDENGKDLPYSEEAAYKLLSNYPEFSDVVFAMSLESERYRLYQEDKAAKN